MKDYSLIAKVSWKLIKIHACINALYICTILYSHEPMCTCENLCRVKYTNVTYTLHLTNSSHTRKANSCTRCNLPCNRLKYTCNLFYISKFKK